MVKPIRYFVLPIIFLATISCGKNGHCDAGPTFEIGILYVDNTGKSIFSNSIYNPDSIKAFDIQLNDRQTYLLSYNSSNLTTYFTADTFINKYAKVAIQFKSQGKYDTLIFHDRGTENELCSNIDSVWYNNILCTTNNNGAISIIK